MAIILVRAASPGLSDGAVGHHQVHGSLQGSSQLLKTRVPPRRWMLCSLRYACLGLQPGEEVGRTSAVYSSLAVNPAGEAVVSSEQKVYDVVLKQAALLKRQLRSQTPPVLDVRPQQLDMPRNRLNLKEAYARCGDICEEYAKTFYLGMQQQSSIIFVQTMVSPDTCMSVSSILLCSWQELC